MSPARIALFTALSAAYIACSPNGTREPSGKDDLAGPPADASDDAPAAAYCSTSGLDNLYGCSNYLGQCDPDSGDDGSTTPDAPND